MFGATNMERLLIVGHSCTICRSHYIANTMQLPRPTALQNSVGSHIGDDIRGWEMQLWLWPERNNLNLSEPRPKVYL